MSAWDSRSRRAELSLECTWGLARPFCNQNIYPFECFFEQGPSVKGFGVVFRYGADLFLLTAARFLVPREGELPHAAQCYLKLTRIEFLRPKTTRASEAGKKTALWCVHPKCQKKASSFERYDIGVIRLGPCEDVPLHEGVPIAVLFPETSCSAVQISFGVAEACCESLPWIRSVTGLGMISLLRHQPLLKLHTIQADLGSMVVLIDPRTGTDRYVGIVTRSAKRSSYATPLTSEHYIWLTKACGLLSLDAKKATARPC